MRLLGNARRCKRTLVGIRAAETNRKTFTRVADYAAEVTYYTCLHRIFDRSNQVASIWYLIRVDARPFSSFARKTCFDIGNLDLIAKKLKILRDKTHFHSDHDFSTSAAFAQADMPWELLDATLDFVCGVLLQIIPHSDWLPEENEQYSAVDATLAVLAIEATETDGY